MSLGGERRYLTFTRSPWGRKDPSSDRSWKRGDLAWAQRIFYVGNCALNPARERTPRGRLEEKLSILTKPKLLIIDELGYLPFDPKAAHLFFQLVSRRYERGSTLITSNRSVGEWGEVFGDPVVATAILDRLLHHSHVVTVRGGSYRLKEKRRYSFIARAYAEL